MSAEGPGKPSDAIRGALRAVAPLVALAVPVLLITAAFFPAALAAVTRVTLLGVCGAALLALNRMVRALIPADPSSTEGRRVAGRSAPVPAELERALALVRFARASAGDVHLRLRPALTAIAAQRLATRYGVDLERQPLEARALLSPALWSLVAPGRPPPRQRLARGITPRELDRLLAELEAL